VLRGEAAAHQPHHIHKHGNVRSILSSSGEQIRAIFERHGKNFHCRGGWRSRGKRSGVRLKLLEFTETVPFHLSSYMLVLSNA
jgi:hypothetical protein